MIKKVIFVYLITNKTSMLNSFHQESSIHFLSFIYNNNNQKAAPSFPSAAFGIPSRSVFCECPACFQSSDAHPLYLLARLSALSSLTTNMACKAPGNQKNNVKIKFNIAWSGLPTSKTATG